MPSSFFAIAGLASVFAFAGIMSLYSAWSRSGAQRLSTWLGWGMFVLSAFVWGSVVGVEYGICVATLIAILGAFLLIAVKGEWPNGPRRPEKQRNGNNLTLQALLQLWVRGILRFLVIAVLPAVSGVVAGLLFFGFAGLTDSSRLVGAAFFTITIWTLAVVWCCADKKILRPSGALVIFSGLSGLVLMPAA